MTNARVLDPLHCAKLILGSNSIVALTGAGISTVAGIPDFRGPQGLYVTRRYDPEKVFEIHGFLREPRYFYEFSRDFVGMVKDVQPTYTHRFLAALEQQGRLAAVVTQNIDMLHQLAGSRNVVELHGSYQSASCSMCGKAFRELRYAWWVEAMTQGSSPPVARCDTCDGVLKPGIVFFGEPVHGFDEAEQAVARCDLLLVLGSTLTVYPASQLPFSTRAATVVVNRGAVDLPPGDSRYFVDSDLDGYFREVAAHLDFGPQQP